MDGNACGLHRKRHQLRVHLFPCDHLVHAGAASDDPPGASAADAGPDISSPQFWDLAARLGDRGSVCSEDHLNNTRDLLLPRTTNVSLMRSTAATAERLYISSR